MTALLQDFVVENANSPGTGTISLAGAATGPFVTFATRFSSGNKVFYAISDESSQREIGIGTFTAGTPDTLSRDTVKANTSGTTAKLNFTGLVYVYCMLPAENAIYLDENGDITPTLGDINVTGTIAATGAITAGGAVTGSNFPAAPTWHDVTSSRVLGTTYTNSHGYTISAAVVTRSSGGADVEGITIAGVDVVGPITLVAGTQDTPFYFQIPAGQTYKIGTGGILQTWFEFY